MAIDLQLFRWHFGRPGDSTIELVLRGHLWIEAQLNKLLLAYVAHPEALELGKTTYASKVLWAHAVDAIDRRDVPWYRALNKARNRLAHELGGDPSADDLAELMRRMRPELQDAIEVMWAGNPDQARLVFGDDRTALRARLRACLVMHVLALEHRAMLQEWRRTNSEKLRRVTAKRVLFALAHCDDQGWTDAMERDARQTYGIPEPPAFEDAIGHRRSSSL